MTTDNGVSAESAEARLERIHQRLGEVRQRTLQLSTRVRAANDTATEIRAAPQKVCHHGEEVKELTAALAHVEHDLDGLRVAMATRGVIERAKGMLMLQERCDEDAAFAMLVELSQRGHQKLVDVAKALVTSWSAGDRGGA